jgi:hypothetical protein
MEKFFTRCLPSVIFLTISCFFSKSFGQGPPTLTSLNIKPTSPDAAAFQRYGDYRVDYSTGLPSIAVPLYELKTARFTLPITLSFHASGFKPKDPIGSVGFGWALNAGPKITRMVQGEPDELTLFPAPFQRRSDINLSDLIDQDYLRAQDLDQTFGGATDAEYDIFYYGTLNGQGKFFLKDAGTEPRIPVTSPFRPIKITSNSNYRASPINYFQIIDEDGNTYRFTKFDETTPDIKQSDINYRSAWVVTEIISNDKSDTIKFTYRTAFRSVNNRTNSFEVKDNVQVINGAPACEGSNGPVIGCSPYSAGSSTYNTLTSISTSSHTVNELTEITFRNGKIRFMYAGGIGSFQFIDRIDVLNKQNQVVRTFDLVQSPFTGSTAYYGLNQVIFKNADQSTLYKYQFDYHTENASTVPPNSRDNTGVDRWGYYNGQVGNQNFLPAWQIPTSTGQIYTSGSANREANEDFAKTFMLNKITYPTGGYTQFFYESNRIADGGPLGYKAIGGLRIKEIRNFSPETGQVNYKQYKYGLDETGFANPQYNPYQLDRFMQTFYDVVMCTFCSTGLEAIGTPASISRTRLVHSDFIDGSGLFETNPVFYTHVTEYEGTGGQFNGKTLYVFEEPVNQYSNDQQNAHLKVVMDWKGNNLLSKTVFKSLSGGGFDEIEKTVNTYNKRQVELLLGMKVFGNIYGKSTGSVTGSCNQGLFCYSIGTTITDPYRFYDYNISTGVSLLATQTITREKTLQETITFTYGNDHNQPLSESRMGGKGQNLLTEFKYPHNSTGLIGEYELARSLMVQQNFISPILQLKKSVNSNLTEQKNVLFRDFGNGIIKQAKIEWAGGNYTPESRLEFLSYDSRSNPQTVQQANDNPVTYLWGYQQSLPTAEVINGRLVSVKDTPPVTDILIFNGPILNNDVAYQPLGSFTVSEPQTVSWAGSINRSNSRYNYFGLVIRNSLGQTLYTIDYSSDVGTISFITPSQLPIGYYTIGYSFDREEPETPNVQLLNFRLTNLIPKSKYRNTILCTSFEENGAVDANPITGAKIWFGTFSVPMPTVIGDYKLTYWERANNSWVFREETIAVTTSNQPDRVIGNSNTFLDELRFYPVNAQVRTFTFDPLRGLTSKMDQKSLVERFELDDWGRLTVVRDEQSQILKQFIYNYKN